MAPAPTSTHAPNTSEVPAKRSLTSSKEGPSIIDLYSGSDASKIATDETLFNDIVKGLQGTNTYTIPGDVDNPEDRKFGFRRTLPTTVLYSEKGLLLYDQLVEAPEYYLWNAEIDILKKYSSEIALRMFGYPTDASATINGSKGDETGDKEEKEPPSHKIPWASQPKDRNNEKWGDDRVGFHNGGVNAEEGLDHKLQSVGPASLVELGAGSLRKTIHLISALKKVAEIKGSQDGARLAIQYYALDLDKSELERTLDELSKQKALSESERKRQQTVMDGTVGINGMWATYDQGLQFLGEGGLAKGSDVEGKRSFLWLGSSIGNFDRRGAAEFLENAARSAMRPGDTMLISMDRRNNASDIAAAYNDEAGLTREFIMQGIHHADKILGGGVLDASKFEYFDRYNATEGRHESYYRALVDQTVRIPNVTPIEIERGELIHVESSYKYNEREALDIFDYAGLRIVDRWTDSNCRYDMWLVERPAFHFTSTRLFTGSRQDIGQGLSPEQANGIRGSWEFDSDAGAGSNSIKEPTVHVSWGLPSPKDWKTLWTAWDTVTLTMISPEMLHQKPIDLRHICLFYIGHIPAFLDIMLARNLNEPHTNEYFSSIFERGIDPHMDDESQCNPHSQIPTKAEDWPSLPDLLDYKSKVVQRVDELYKDVFNGDRKLDRRLARLLWLTLEHKALHLETLLYMLIQSDLSRPPHGFVAPDWNLLSRQWDEADRLQGGKEARESTLNFKADLVTLGHDDKDQEDFIHVASRPSSNIDDLNEQLGSPEFGWDNESPKRQVSTEAFSITAAPVTNGDYLEYLRSIGSKEYPSSWVASADEEPRVRTLYGPVEMRIAHLWPCQASAIALEAYANWKGGRLPTQAELQRFLDATGGPNCTDRPGTNIGFRNWHPVPSQLARPDHDGTVLPGHNGGVWEWTSTILAPYEGYKQSVLYPGYSSDFFDGKHLIVLGGSYVTVPSIAGRRTVTNWYQAPYPYVFAGARVVYDASTPKRARAQSPHKVR